MNGLGVNLLRLPLIIQYVPTLEFSHSVQVEVWRRVADLCLISHFLKANRSWRLKSNLAMPGRHRRLALLNYNPPPSYLIQVYRRLNLLATILFVLLYVSSVWGSGCIARGDYGMLSDVREWKHAWWCLYLGPLWWPWTAVAGESLVRWLL